MRLFVCETCMTFDPVGWTVPPDDFAHLGHKGSVLEGGDYETVSRTAARHLALAARLSHPASHPAGLS